MARYGKWIGGALGWAFAGPLGALFGFVLGTVADASIPRVIYQPRSNTQAGDFRLSLLALFAAIMKADNKLMRSELEFIKQLFSNSFGSAAAAQMMPVLQDLLKKDIPLNDICSQIRTHMDHPARLQLLHMLLGLSLADNEYHSLEDTLLLNISKALGISDKDFISLKAQFVKDPDSAYKILEISPKATDDEVKKAYRKMAAKFHPDKVSHLGEDVAKSAAEKFKSLNEAYEIIKKSRGIR